MDNNLYVANLSGGKREAQLTGDGELNRIINGASDWVYEEEFGKDRGFFGLKMASTSRITDLMRPRSEFSMPMYGSLYPRPLHV